MTHSIVASDVALILETNNLASMPAAHAVASMSRLLHHLRAQSLPLQGLGELVITHHGLSEHARAQLVRAAARPIVFVPVAAGTGYYEAKNLGFAACRAPHVAFGDADCWPDRDWLRELVAPLSMGWEAAAGRTTYAAGVLGAAMTSIDFMYFRDEAGATTRNFYANNVAFTREVFAAHGYPPAASYRGACQVLGMRLYDAGIAIRYAHAARTVHRLPRDVSALTRQRLRRGRDLRLLAPQVLEAALPTREARPVPAPTRRLAGVVVAGRWVSSMRHLRRTSESTRHRIAASAVMTCVAGLDTLGAMGRR